MLKPKKLEIAVVFHYVKDRVKYLKEICSYFDLLADEVNATILTNDPDKKDELFKIIKGITNLEIKIYDSLSDPFLLTCEHIDFLRGKFADTSITHFMYLEDDMCIKPQNIDYWMRNREVLRPYNLYPSFLRYEIRENDINKYSTDCMTVRNFRDIPKIEYKPDYWFVNCAYPYQGMYLLDRELMQEHLDYRSKNIQPSVWDIRAQATQGLTFYNVPQGFTSRNVLGYLKNENKIDENALIHHTPNNYTCREGSPFGKIPVNKIFNF